MQIQQLYGNLKQSDSNKEFSIQLSCPEELYIFYLKTYSHSMFSVQRSCSVELEIFCLKTSSHSDFIGPIAFLVHKVSAHCKYNIFRKPETIRFRQRNFKDVDSFAKRDFLTLSSAGRQLVTLAALHF